RTLTGATDVSIFREWDGRKIRIRPSDRYVCLTDMAKAAGKKFSNWWQLNDAQDYVEKFSEKAGIPALKLIEINRGRGNVTWGHPKIALRFAQWCSTEFAIQVDFWIDELLDQQTSHHWKSRTRPHRIPSRSQSDPV
ncbi:MAG: KilA-N domain-containing protein, partial [Cyanobacteriota bacterium]|nr:KilA-N domain-containing protein [Cyanobacteriota bacterium]